jgi:pimeloyl-ACP methyl ester carboxylesterase
MGALEFLCDVRFHQSFFLTAQDGRPEPFRISYADYGDRHSDAVVLFCGALMATRFCYSPLDELAKAYNVRIIHPDRPGVGGSDRVEIHQRIALWLGAYRTLLEGRP